MYKLVVLTFPPRDSPPAASSASQHMDSLLAESLPISVLFIQGDVGRFSTGVLNNYL